MVCTHHGPHGDLGLTYSGVGSFAARNGLRAHGLVQEV